MKWKYRTGGIPDHLFIRGSVPMTKSEVRAVTLSKLRLEDNSVVVDVGAGTGSIAIEVAHICTSGKVFAIERNNEAIQLIKENCTLFGVDMEVIHGHAAECLNKIDYFDRIVIGGSGGELRDIIETASEKLLSGGICVVNCITIETLYHANELFKEKKFHDIEVIAVSITRGKSTGKYTLMEALNPVFILSGMKPCTTREDE